MTEFTQDKIFKNVNQEDARILLNIMGKNSKKVKIWTKELRLLDPKDYKPDIIVELDNENLIIELQSTKVNDEFSKRALTFVSITNRDKDNDKEVNLMVLSSAENSKTVHYRYNFQNVFNYDVVGLEDLGVKQIINNVEPKIINNDNIIGHDLVLYALLPIIDSRNMEKHIRRVVNNLLKLKYMTISLKELSFGIEWLIVDKYVSDEEERNILCDLLGDKMSLIHEYGERKEQKGRLKGIEEGRLEGIEEGRLEGIEEGRLEGIEEGRLEGIRSIILKFHDSGMLVCEISERSGMSISEINDMIKSNN